MPRNFPSPFQGNATFPNNATTVLAALTYDVGAIPSPVHRHDRSVSSRKVTRKSSVPGNRRPKSPKLGQLAKPAGHPSHVVHFSETKLNCNFFSKQIAGR